MGTGLRKFIELLRGEDGFLVVHDVEGTVLTIPSGYLTVTMGKFDAAGKGATGIRWGFLSDSKVTNSTGVPSVFRALKGMDKGNIKHIINYLKVGYSATRGLGGTVSAQNTAMGRGRICTPGKPISKK
jgi:hypothetical protein